LVCCILQADEKTCH